MRYHLGALAKGKKVGSVGLMPMIAASAGMERAYLSELRKLLQEAARGIRDIVLPAYDRKSAITTDADESSMTAMQTLLELMKSQVVQKIVELTQLESIRHADQFMKEARKAFSVDLEAVIRSEDIGGYLDASALRSASLVKGMTDDLIKRIAQETTNSLIQGESAATLKGKLKTALGVSDSRARLIARDQTGKLASDLTRIRHQQAGIERYIWRTSHDDRVRARHVSIDGNEYEYGKPTGAEDGLPPGQPIQCRCIAQGIVVFGPIGTKPSEPVTGFQAEEVKPQTDPAEAAAAALAAKKLKQAETLKKVEAETKAKAAELAKARAAAKAAQVKSAKETADKLQPFKPTKKDIQ